MADREFTNINGIKVCDQTARDNIPTKTSQLENDSNFVTDSVVDEKITNAQLGSEVEELQKSIDELRAIVSEQEDLSNYAKKTDLPTRTSQLENDSNFITNIPDEYITEAELAAKGYATTSQIPAVPTNVSAFTNDSNYATQTYVANKISEASLSGGEVDLSGYVTKETGNANQITFSDGQTFQAKLNAGTLKGDKGDAGEQGPQGIQGERGPSGADGQDGLTTSILVNGNTYTHINGIITLPDYPSSADGTSLSFKSLSAGEILKISGTDGPLTYGNIVISKSSATITEGGTDTFTIMLDKAPTNNQVVNITTNNTDVTVNPTSLTFTADNYNVAQTITITVAEDDDYTNDTCIVTVSSANVTNKILTLTITDNDEPPIIAVTGISLPSSLTINKNKTATLTATVSPSDATNKNIVWSANNTNCTVNGTSLTATVTGVTAGEAIITATTEDGNYSATCTVTIEEVSSGGLVQDGLLSYYKASSATTSLLPDEQGVNDITLAGTPTVGDGYVTFNTSDQNGTCDNFTGFTTDGAGDFTIMICVNITNGLERTLLTVGAGTYIGYQMGGAEVGWANIVSSNIACEGSPYQVMNIQESIQLGTDIVYTLKRSGLNQYLYLDSTQKETKGCTNTALQSYSSLTLMESSSTSEIKLKSLAIYNSALTEDEIASNVNVLKGGN